MKKLSALLLAVAITLTIAGCQFGTDGMIGEADGPTKNIVPSEKEGNQYRNQKEPVKVVMVDGGLYYETDEDYDMKSRDGTLDGSFKKTVDKWELPKNDHEANFELKNKDYSGYQIGVTEGTIEVPIGDDWEIFKKIDSETDLSKYKYVLKVEGDTPYKHGETEYIVLTNTLDITANDVAKSELSTDSKDHLDLYIVERDWD